MTELHEQTASDPNCTAAEKETSITMYGDAKEMLVSSGKRTIVKSLLQHDNFDLHSATLYDDDGDRYRYVSSREEADELDADIVFVSGRMPIGCLTVKSSPRSNNNQSGIVNHEGVKAGAFE